MDDPKYFLYSEALLSFREKCLYALKKIIREEIGLEVKSKRFLYQNYLYPLEIVVFEHPKILGHFTPDNYRIGINKRLYLFKDDGVELHQEILNILRHELAHYLCWIEYGDKAKAHGPEFRSLCERYAWGRDVWAAKSDLLSGLDEEEKKQAHYLEKIKKMLNLSQSSNPHEAQAALLKAKEWQEEYHITLDHQDSSETLLAKILSYPRQNTKMLSISEILETFNVFPVINVGRGKTYLEVVGSREDVELAEYLAFILDQKLEEMWNQEKKQNPRLKGLRAKNSFFYGVARGYLQKNKEIEKNLSSHKSLMAQKKAELAKHKQRAYPRLARSFSQNIIDPHANQAGTRRGQSLSLNPALKSKQSSSTLLGYRLKKGR